MPNLGRISYILLSGLARILPHRLAYLIGETLGVLGFLLLTKRRRNLYGNLRVALGNPSERTLRATGFGVMLNFGRGIVETLLVPHLDDAYLARHVQVTDKADLRSLAGKRRGIVLATAHLGSWELGGFTLARMGYKITTVAGIQFMPALSPSVKAIKAQYGITVTSAQGGMLRLFRALRRGEIVALHIDGDQYMGGLEATFFGRRTVMPRGPAALAMRTGAALVPAFAVRSSRSQIHIYIEDPIPTQGEDEVGVTRRLLAVVEDFIRRNPGQWSMFRTIWERDR
jgi:KDO2-lipid IV(A) lauroyltransferase